MDIDDPVFTSELTFDNLLKKPLHLKCAYCKHSTNHKVLKSVEDKWGSDFGLTGNHNHLIVQCLGCDIISYCKESSDNETYDEAVDERGITILNYKVITDQYPTVNTAYQNPQPFSSMPKAVELVYHETYKALTHGLDKLSGSGIRQIVETVCIVNGIKRGLLSHKINELYSGGLVTEEMKDLLHNVRLFGNIQVHQIGSPEFLELTEAWGAVNTFLASLYGTHDANERFRSLNLNSRREP